MSNSLLITGASQIVTVRGRGPRRGKALSEIGIIRDGAILVGDGVIVAVGPSRKIEKLKDSKKAEKVDVGGRVVLPGFVDAHTHLIHAASRAEEYELKIRGASYEEIARKGGGILNSVKKLRAATAEELKGRARGFLEKFAEHGTTTIEAKSGYGLDVTSELRILSLHKELDAEQPLEIVSTFLGAHVVPAEYRGKANGTRDYLELLTDKLLPEVAENGLAEYCDVFCERGAFSLSESRRAAFEYRRDADGDCAGSGELRSPGIFEGCGYTGAGKIGNSSDAVAGMRFSFGIGEVCAGAGVD